MPIRECSSCCRTSLALVALGLAFLLFLACGPGANGRSGGDQERAAALPVPLGSVVDDRVSAADGDQTDWKRFHLDDTDQVNLAVYWDDPDVEGAIEIRNAFGNPLGRREHTKGEEVDRMTATLEGGDYFVSIMAEGAGSVYSLEISTGAAHTGGTSPVRRGGGDERPE